MTICYMSTRGSHLPIKVIRKRLNALLNCNSIVIKNGFVFKHSIQTTKEIDIDNNIHNMFQKYICTMRHQVEQTCFVFISVYLFILKHYTPLMLSVFIYLLSTHHLV